MSIDPGERAIAALSHVLGIITGFLGPLVVLLAQRHRPFTRAHAAAALNFQITLLIAYLVALIPAIAGYLGELPALLLITFLLDAVLLIASVVLVVVAAVAANRGRPYRYPLSIRFVRPAPAV